MSTGPHNQSPRGMSLQDRGGERATAPLGPASGTDTLLLDPKSQTCKNVCEAWESLLPSYEMRKLSAAPRTPAWVQMSPGQIGYSQKPAEMVKRDGLSYLYGL